MGEADGGGGPCPTGFGSGPENCFQIPDIAVGDPCLVLMDSYYIKNSPSITTLTS